MKGRSLTPYSDTRLRRIHALSSDMNCRGIHAERLLDMIRGHAREISELFYACDEHFITETGDLIVLCLELIIEAQSDPDRVLNECYGRFEKKLKAPGSDRGEQRDEEHGRSPKEE